MLHTQSEEDSSAGRGSPPRKQKIILSWALSTGSAEGDSNIRSKAKLGRTRSGAPSAQRVDRTFLHDLRGKRGGGPSLAPSRNADSCHLFLQTVGGVILASPHDNLAIPVLPEKHCGDRKSGEGPPPVLPLKGALSIPFLPKSMYCSHAQRGFLQGFRLGSFLEGGAKKIRMRCRHF